MATFFGEVLPVYSRAVDDDDDDDEEEEVTPECNCIVKWTPTLQSEITQSESGKLQCNILVIAIGTAATGFCQTYLMNERYDVIGGIFAGIGDRDVNTFSQKSPTDKACYVHRSQCSPEVLVCQCNIDVQPEQAYSWVQQFLGVFDFSDAYVGILTTAMTSEFKTDVPVSEMTTPFLRALRTGPVQGTPVCPYLEQPNVASGLPAQVMSYCHVHDVKAVLYVCYTDTFLLDSATMKAFKPILRSTPIKDVIQDNPKAEEKLKQIVELHTRHNTLYL